MEPRRFSHDTNGTWGGANVPPGLGVSGIGQHGFIWDSAAGNHASWAFTSTPSCASQQQSAAFSNRRDSGREHGAAAKDCAPLRLSEPLAERVRPTKFSGHRGPGGRDQIAEGDPCAAKIRSTCIIYGPPGVGQDLRRAPGAGSCQERARAHPFCANAPFIEMDATCVRFDERAIADPLIGSVHDPDLSGGGAAGCTGYSPAEARRGKLRRTAGFCSWMRSVSCIPSR